MRLFTSTLFFTSFLGTFVVVVDSTPVVTPNEYQECETNIRNSILSEGVSIDAENHEIRQVISDACRMLDGEAALAYGSLRVKSLLHVAGGGKLEDEEEATHRKPEISMSELELALSPPEHPKVKITPDVQCVNDDYPSTFYRGTDNSSEHASPRLLATSTKNLRSIDDEWTWHMLRMAIPGDTVTERRVLELAKVRQELRFLGPVRDAAFKSSGNEIVEAREEESSDIDVAIRCEAKCLTRKKCVAFVVSGSIRRIRSCRLYEGGLTDDGTDATKIKEEKNSYLFLKNVNKETYHELRPINAGTYPELFADSRRLAKDDLTRYSSSKAEHIFVIGDWGSIITYEHYSMHYKVKRDKEEEPWEWNRDHFGQIEVGSAMIKQAQLSRPKLVLNVGDNFYWGGFPPRGNSVHNWMWKKGFENVYYTPELNIPWIGCLGNHDYGGVGCLSDTQAQFDYTLYDRKKRWKIPSEYFTQKVDFGGGNTLEVFSIDSNKANVYKICNQTLCTGKFKKITNFDDCSAFINKTWDKQLPWFEKALRESTARWKIVITHYKWYFTPVPKLVPLLAKYGVQLAIMGHAHETSYKHGWQQARRTGVMTVGQSGGAQSWVNCLDDGSDFCANATDYSFGDMTLSRTQLRFKFIRGYDHKTIYNSCITADGRKCK